MSRNAKITLGFIIEGLAQFLLISSISLSLIT